MTVQAKMTMSEALQATADKIKELDVIGSAEQAEECDAVVCISVDALPIPKVPAVVGECSSCGDRIWVSKNSPQKPARICYKCFVTASQKLDADTNIKISMTEKSAEVLGLIRGKDERSN